MIYMDGASSSYIARLVERAAAAVGSSGSSFALQTEVARVREAHTRWRAAATEREVGVWTFKLGNRALSAALTAHLESLERGAGASALASTLLEVCFAVAGCEGRALGAGPPPAVPAQIPVDVPSFMHLATAPPLQAAVATATMEVVPPPLIGPLANLAAAKEEAASSVEAREAPKPLSEESAASAALAPERFSLEVCAAVTASLARKKREREAILEERHMTASEWSSLEADTAAALKAESALGRRELLARYDDAYVAQLEAERGVIDVPQFVKLSLAQERGTITEVLDELELPRGAMPRVSRVWLRRMSADRQLARQVREAMREAGA